MTRKFLITGVAVLLLAPWILCESSLGGEAMSYGEEIAGAEEAASAVVKLPPVAIGAIRPAGQHLVRPRQEVIEMMLRRDKVIKEGATPKEVEAAVRSYVKRFGKKTSSWVSPEVRERALRIESEEMSPTARATAVQPVTAKVLAFAVEFGGTDTFTYYAKEGDACVEKEATTTGPLKGLIPHPGERDNNTVWYPPEQTADAGFYEKLIFGYEGMGRIRPDLTDPYDGQPGINLAGYTVQDYYDHVAGPGNVTLQGVVKGWIRVNHSEGYYGADVCDGAHYGGGPVPIGQLVVDAVRKFNRRHPAYYNDTSARAFWPKFDGNKDGVVDTLWIIHAGMGQESGGGAEGDFAIWSHSGDLRNFRQWRNGFKVYEGDPSTTEDDIYAGPYTMQPESLDLGVLTEEFGHNFFGFPDLYTTDYNNSVGFWSNMSAGSWGGPLGGAVPVGMPLWFRMIAQCGDVPCNWHRPMAVKSNISPASEIKIGQLEETPPRAFKGVRINLPNQEEEIPNRAGAGKAAYTDTGRDDLDIYLHRGVNVPAAAAGILSFSSYWDIEEDWDYGYLMIKSGETWTMLDDMDGVFRETNPNGTNLGHGLTGTGNQVLRFDLSAYKGQTVRVGLRYKTDGAVTNPGWWVDDVKLDDTVIDDFEAAVAPRRFPGWRNTSSRWVVAPLTKTYAHYYLLEWRAETKYDKMVKTAYITTYGDEDEWQVERVPYNIPGALLYYRNAKYSNSYSIGPNTFDVPSVGPKYQLLVVDMNYGPLRIGDTPEAYKGYLSTTAGSYDAALTMQPTEAFTLSRALGYDGPWEFPSKPAVKRFDDALGYYAGFYFGPPCADGSVCYNNYSGSVVIPALGIYSTRITDFDGAPHPEVYGNTVGGMPLGTGNPGDLGLEYGLTVDLLRKSPDNSRAIVRINGPQPADSTP